MLFTSQGRSVLGKKTVPEVLCTARGLQNLGHSFPNTDRPWLVNNIYFSTEGNGNFCLYLLGKG